MLLSLCGYVCGMLALDHLDITDRPGTYTAIEWIVVGITLIGASSAGSALSRPRLAGAGLVVTGAAMLVTSVAVLVALGRPGTSVASILLGASSVLLVIAGIVCLRWKQRSHAGGAPGDRAPGPSTNQQS